MLNIIKIFFITCLNLLVLSELQSRPVGKGLSCFPEDDLVINYELFMIDEDAGNPGDCKNFLCIPNDKITEFYEHFDFMHFIKNVTTEFNNFQTF